jgi:outer membrane protein assembly factor BamB
MIRAAALPLLAMLFVPLHAFADADWPRWRGPSGTGITEAPGFDPTLNGGEPEVLWSAQVGNGYGQVTVAGGRAYVAGHEDGRETLYCFEAATGEPLWSNSYKAKKFDNMNAGGPAATPAVAQGRVFHVSRDGKALALNAETGKPVWDIDLTKQFGSQTPKWGFAGSPILEDGDVMIDAGRIVRLEADSGEVIWQSENFGAAYSTPVPFTVRGKRFVAAFPESGLVILDAKTGKTLAQHRWKTSYGVNAATPVIKDDMIFISSGYNTGGAVLRLTDRGLQVVWEGRQMRNQIPTCVLIDGYLYGFDDSRLKCLAFATGEEQWDVRGLGQGTVIATADGILIVQSDKGEVLTAKASPDGFDEIARVQVIDERRVWTAPTLADGRLFCRGSRGTLKVLDVSKD